MNDSFLINISVEFYKLWGKVYTPIGDSSEAILMLQLAPNGFLESMSAEKQKAQQSLGL